MHERYEAEEVFPKFPEGEAELNQGAICKNISCERKSVARSTDCTSAKLFPAKKRHFQIFKKEYHEKWSWKTRKVALMLTQSSQYGCEMIGLADS